MAKTLIQRLLRTKLKMRKSDANLMSSQGSDEVPKGVKTVGGAVGGAILGGAVAGPIGALAGLIIGGLLGRSTEEEDEEEDEEEY